MKKGAREQINHKLMMETMSKWSDYVRDLEADQGLKDELLATVDELESANADLTKRVEELEKALRPFARMSYESHLVLPADYRRARKVLKRELGRDRDEWR